MRNIILVALVISLAILVGCKEKASQPPMENTMNSMDTQSMEKPEESMQQSPETMEAPAAATEEPAPVEGAGSAQ